MLGAPTRILGPDRSSPSAIERFRASLLRTECAVDGDLETAVVDAMTADEIYLFGGMTPLERPEGRFTAIP